MNVASEQKCFCPCTSVLLSGHGRSQISRVLWTVFSWQGRGVLFLAFQLFEWAICSSPETWELFPKMPRLLCCFLRPVKPVLLQSPSVSKGLSVYVLVTVPTPIFSSSQPWNSHVVKLHPLNKERDVPPSFKNWLEGDNWWKEQCVCKADGPLGMQYPCSQRLVPCGAQSVPLGDGPWFSMVGRVWITMEEQEVAKEEWGLFLLLLLLFWFFFHFFLVSLWLHRIGDLRCKITHEGAEVCLEGLLFPGAPGILLDDHHGHCSCSGWSEISALASHNQQGRLFPSGSPGLTHYLWCESMLFLVMWTPAGLTPGAKWPCGDGCFWPGENLNDWPKGKSLGILLLIPSSSPIPISSPPPPLFFFFFKFILKEHLLHQLLEYLNCIMSTGPSQTDILY